MENKANKMGDAFESVENMLIRLAKEEEINAKNKLLQEKVPNNTNITSTKDVEKNKMETIIQNDKITTSLTRVSSYSINQYADAVGKMFDIPKELRLFAAYFCKLENTSVYNGWADKNMPAIRLTFDRNMNGNDFLESLRVVLDNPDNNTIKLLTGKNIADYTNNLPVEIQDNIFPEYGILKEIIDSRKESRKTNQYVELLKIPQQGRTFYAGVISSVLEPNVFISAKTKKVIQEPTQINIPRLDISSKNATDYARNKGITDYVQYLKLLQDNA